MVYYVTKETQKILCKRFTLLSVDLICDYMGCDRVGKTVHNCGIGKFLLRGIPDHPFPNFINPRDASFIRVGAFRYCIGLDIFEGQTFRLMARIDDHFSGDYVLCVAPDTMYGSQPSFSERPDLRIRQFWETRCSMKNKHRIVQFFVETLDEIFKTTLICPLCGGYEKLDGFVDKHCRKCMCIYNLNPCISCGVHFGSLKHKRHLLCYQNELKARDIHRTHFLSDDE
jgi:hypothetical protein